MSRSTFTSHPRVRARAGLAGLAVALACAACNGQQSSMTPESSSVYRAAAYENATLSMDPSGQLMPRTRYQIAQGNALVLLLDHTRSGRLFTYDTAREWVIAIELPHATLAAAAAAGSIDVTTGGIKVFGRMAAGEVMYLSFQATGTVQVTMQNDTPVAEIQIEFHDPAIALTRETTLPIAGRFALDTASP